MVLSRREFIKKALYRIAGLLGLGYLFTFFRTLEPLPGRKKKLAWFPLLPEEEMPRAGVRKTEVAYTVNNRERKSRVFIVASSAGVIVLSAVCSHLGCLVNYRKELKEFVCPCHGGKYDITGRNISGPPPAPLTRLPVKMEKGMMMVGIKV